MTEQRPTLEKIAPTIEEAIENGLEELGLPREAVDVEILDEGNKGLFGLGSRQARVLLTLKETTDPVPEMVSAKQEEIFPEVKPEISEPEPVDATPSHSDEVQVLQIARDIVIELLDKMKVSAEVTASYIEDDDYNGRKPILVEKRVRTFGSLIRGCTRLSYPPSKADQTTRKSHCRSSRPNESQTGA